MNESIDDIAYLLEAELAKFSPPAVRTPKLPPAPAVTGPDEAATQAAMARELLDIDGAHEALIRQYMQISGYLA